MSCNVVKPYRTEISDHSTSPVSVERAKEHMMIYEDDFDALIARYISSATASLEAWTNYYMMPATITSFFKYCKQCAISFALSKRPFNSLVSVEVLQEGVYVALTAEQYSVTETDWEVFVTLCESVEVDTECEDVDPIRILYSVGDYTEIDLINTLASGSVPPFEVKSDCISEHGLIVNDQIQIKNVDETTYNGTFGVSGIYNSTSFQYLLNVLALPGLGTGGTVLIPNIPAQLEQGLLMMVASMYTNRGDCSDACGPVPCAVQSTAGQYRRVVIGASGRNYGCTCG